MLEKTSRFKSSSIGSRIFDVANTIFLIILAFATLYPFYYVAIISFSGPSPVLRGEVYLFPKEISFASYASILKNLFRIVLPLSLPSIATIGLFYSVGHWNSFMSALIYLTDKTKFPLQLVLRMMLVESYVDPDYANVNEDSEVISLTIKYAAVMVSTVPILFVYPFIQKYFVKGALIGSLKG
jgi:ABC-type glycerol-3-phosphate transport system permease component